MRKILMITWAMTLVGILAGGACIAGVPGSISYQGKLTNTSGAPVADGNYSLAVKFYTVETLGAPTWTSPAINVTTIGGVFTARIEGIPPTAMPGPDVWVETVVGAETLAPRVKLTSVPFALQAGDLSLPFAKSYSDPGSLLSLTNTGTGGGIVAVTSGNGAALTAVAGTGKAAAFTGDVSVSGMADVGGLKLATGANAGYVLISDAFGQGSWQPPVVAGGGIGGSGTANYIPWWTGTGTLGDSVIYQDANKIGIGTTTPAAGLDVLTSANLGIRSETTVNGGTAINGVANHRAAYSSFPIGVSGTSTVGIGVQGNGSFNGVYGISENTGVYGNSTGAYGRGVYGSSDGEAGVYGNDGNGTDGIGIGVKGHSRAGTGVFGETYTGSSAIGVHGISGNIGVQGDGGACGVYATGTASLSKGLYASGDKYGVYAVNNGGTNNGNCGIYAQSATGPAVYGRAFSVTGVKGVSDSGEGTYGYSGGGRGAVGQSGSAEGVYGSSTSASGGYFTSTTGSGIYAQGGYWGADIHGSQGGIIVNGGPGTGIYATGSYWGADIQGGSQGGIHAKTNGGPWGAVIDGGSQGGIWTTGTGGLWGASITGGSQGGITASANGGLWGASITGGTSGGIKVTGGTPNRAAQFWGNTEVIGNVYVYSAGAGTPMVAAIGEGLDYAEGFDVSSGDDAAPGTVLIIDTKNAGKLAVSRSAYDRKVAGIVAGAKDLDSGVKLGLGKYDHNVALAGRVYCNVDATRAAVEPGDLLTTSSTPGYAMKSSDYSRAQGAILGKAMEQLEKGKKGQILVLVTLQ